MRKRIKRKNYFGFQDEVGLLHTPKEDRVFGLGLLKIEHPRLIHQGICRYKDRKAFNREFKFSDVTSQSLPLYQGLVDIFLNTYKAYFACLMFDKRGIDLKAFFKGNHNLAYNAFLASLLAHNLKPYEYIAVIADDVSTPKSDNYERDIRRRLKKKLDRDALFGICRVESHAVSEIQITDVLLGTVAYDFKLKYGLVKPNSRAAKFRLVKHLRGGLGVQTLAEDLFVKKPVHFRVDEFQPMTSPRKL